MNSSAGRKSGLVFAALVFGACLCSRMGAANTAITTTVSRATAAPAIAKVAIPSSAIAGQTNLLAAVRLREPNATLDRIAQWIGPMAPAANPDVLRALAAAKGLNFNLMTPGGNAAAFVWKPATNAPQTSWAGMITVLLPLDVTNASRLPEAAVASFGKYSIFAQDQTQLDAATGKKDQMYAIAQTQVQGDLEISINSKAVMAEYGKAIRGAFKGFQRQMAMGMNAATNMAPSNAVSVVQFQKMLNAEFQAFLDAVDQIQDLTLSISFLPDAIEFAGVVEAEKATTLASILNSGPVNAPDLMRFIPANGTIQMQETISHSKQIGDIYLRYVRMMMDPAKSNDVAALETLVADAAKLGDSTVAGSFGADTNGGLQAEYIMAPEHADAFMPLLHKELGTDKDSPIRNFYRDMGVDLTIRNHATAQKEGMQIESYDLSFAMTNLVPNASNPLLAKMLGTIRLQVAQMGPCVLVSIGKPLEELAQRVRSGTGATNAAMKDFAPGAVAYVSYNVPAYLQMVKAMMPPEAAGKFPVLDPSVPPVTLAVYCQDGKAFSRVRIPRALIAAFVEAVHPNAAPVAAQSKARPTGVPAVSPVPMPASQPAPAAE